MLRKPRYAQPFGHLGRVRLNLFFFHLYRIAESKEIEIIFLKLVHRFKSFISFTLFDLISSPELPCDIVSVNTLGGRANCPSI